MGDAKGARQFIEKTLLPTLKDFKVMDYFLPVRAQYAVVLAYCGDFVAARRELSMLDSFRESASPEWIREVDGQAALIKEIEQGKVLLRAPAKAAAILSHQPVRTEKRIGRNDPCPCRSGKKYKMCCGK